MTNFLSQIQTIFTLLTKHSLPNRVNDNLDLFYERSLCRSIFFLTESVDQSCLDTLIFRTKFLVNLLGMNSDKKSSKKDHKCVEIKSNCECKCKIYQQQISQISSKRQKLTSDQIKTKSSAKRKCSHPNDNVLYSF